MPLRVCVIGAGVIGAAVAAAVAETNAKVTVVSAEPLGRDTSSASFAWLNALEKRPATYTLMNINGMRRHADYAKRHGDAPWFHRGGNVHITYGGAETEKQAEVMTEIAAFDYEARWISAQELCALEPDIDPAQLSGAEISYYPGEGWISGALLIARLLADARAAGATIMSPARVVGFNSAGDRITEVRLQGGETIAADVVINCAGPAGGALAALAGCGLPLRNEVGVQVYTAPCAVTLGRVLHSAKLNLRPDGAGRICLHDYGTDRKVTPLTGSTREELETTAGAYRFDLADAKSMTDELHRLYPATRGIPIEAARIGLRPVPADRRPVIGFFGACPNLYAAVMHSGVTQALRVGELVAREIVRGKEVEDLSAFRPLRFATGESSPL